MLVNMFPEVIFNKRVLSGTVFPRIWLFCFVRSTKQKTEKLKHFIQFHVLKLVKLRRTNNEQHFYSI